ncbi:MAG TPA: DNA-protecting protein DprA [Flavobacteriales bacterium]|nr:DNA-protecting protein DprA [Flavobacteriales bacterium]|tara:strand:+ start:77501 stop:78616 length:1116 start_codon:yes stop_codon:yes gene_type:complete
MTTEIYYLIALKFLPNIGDITIKKLVQYFGSAQKVWEASKEELRLVPEIKISVVKALQNDDLKKEALLSTDNEVNFIEKEGINVVHYWDEEYPSLLFHCADSPVLLYFKGRLKWGAQKFISIVGTRKMTSYGESFLEKLMETLAPIQPVIVSGLAYGVDIKAHQLAIQHNLPTIACVAHGLSQVYPDRHKKYLPDIINNGAIVTEFPHFAFADKENFPKRNRIIAGLSDCTIVIESGAKGGSLITADLAFGYNREVFALPGRVTDKFSAGCNKLIKTQKAHLLSSPEDIFYIMQWEKNGKKKAHQQQLFVELSKEEQQLIDFLRTRPDNSADIDTISIQTGVPVHLLASLLLNLEFNGLIKSLPGKRYMVV